MGRTVPAPRPDYNVLIAQGFQPRASSTTLVAAAWLRPLTRLPMAAPRHRARLAEQRLKLVAVALGQGQPVSILPSQCAMTTDQRPGILDETRQQGASGLRRDPHQVGQGGIVPACSPRRTAQSQVISNGGPLGRVSTTACRNASFCDEVVNESRPAGRWRSRASIASVNWLPDCSSTSSNSLRTAERCRKSSQAAY